MWALGSVLTEYKLSVSAGFEKFKQKREKYKQTKKKVRLFTASLAEWVQLEASLWRKMSFQMYSTLLCSSPKFCLMFNLVLSEVGQEQHDIFFPSEKPRLSSVTDLLSSGRPSVPLFALCNTSVAAFRSSLQQWFPFSS